MTSLSTARPITSPRPVAPHAAVAGPTLDPVRIIKQHRIALLLSLVIGAVVGIGAYFVLRQFLPSYRSTIVYQAFPPISNAGQGDAPQVDREEFERYVATEARVITSETVLRDAAQTNRQLRENTDWIKGFLSGGEPDVARVVRELKDIVSARPITGTQFIEVSVSAPKKEDVAIIAGAVHDSYFRDLGDRTRRNTADKKGPLSTRKNQLQGDINRIDAKDQQIMREKGIEGLREEINRDYVLINQVTPIVAESSQRLQQATTEKNRLENFAKAEGGIQYTDTQRDQVERSALISTLKERLAGLEAEDHAKAMQGFGEGHQVRIQLHTQIDSTRAKLEESKKDELAKTFAADLDAARRAVEQNEAVLKEMGGQLDTAKAHRGEIAQALLEIDKNREDRLKLISELAKVEADLADIDMIDSLRSSDRIGRVRRIESPRTPDTLSFPRAAVIIPLGIFAVAALTLAFVVLRELFDQRVRGPADITLIPRLRLLGIVPEISEDPTNPPSAEMAFKDAPTGAISESFRHIRAPISKRMAQAGFKSLLVMSGAPGSGATSAVANLALQAAATEQRVLIVDANFRRPNLHKVFKLGEGPGLGDLLSKKSTLDQAVQQTAFPNLSLLAAGSAGTRSVSERLATDSMSQILAEAQGKYDLVIIDTAPALVAGDGFSLANKCDAVVVVVKALSEKRGFIARIRDQLHDVKAEFIGVIVNSVRGTAGGYLKKNIKTAFEYQNDRAA